MTETEMSDGQRKHTASPLNLTSSSPLQNPGTSPGTGTSSMATSVQLCYRGSHAQSAFLRQAAAYILQLERERDGLLVRCQQLEAQLALAQYPADHGEFEVQGVPEL